MSRKFHISVVLTITTGRFLCSDFGDVYEILNHMTKDDLYTHALIRASEECKPYLLDQCPDLKNIVVPQFNLDQNKDKETVIKDIEKWILSLLVSGHKEFYDIAPIPQDDHDIINPNEELLRLIRPDQKLITFNLDDENKTDDSDSIGNLPPKTTR